MGPNQSLKRLTAALTPLTRRCVRYPHSLSFTPLCFVDRCTGNQFVTSNKLCGVTTWQTRSTNYVWLVWSKELPAPPAIQPGHFKRVAKVTDQIPTQWMWFSMNSGLTIYLVAWYAGGSMRASRRSDCNSQQELSPTAQEAQQWTPTGHSSSQRPSRSWLGLRSQWQNPSNHFPLLMSHRSKLATLAVNDAHKRTLHGGLTATVAEMRRQIWVTQAMKKASAGIKKCVTWFQFNSRPTQQLMSDLPSSRIEAPERAFSCVGLDFADL